MNGNQQKYIYKNIILEIAKTVKQRINELYENEEPDYLHGECQQWVINNFKPGDLIIVFQEYDYDIDKTCMAHSLIFRNNKYIDARGEMDDIEEVLDEFDCTDDDMLEFKTLKQFKTYLKNMKIPYK